MPRRLSKWFNGWDFACLSLTVHRTTYTWDNIWDWFVVSVLPSVSAFSWNQLLRFKSQKACTNYIRLSQNVLTNCWNNKNSSSVDDSNEEAAIKRERFYDQKLTCELQVKLERPDASQNSRKLFCYLICFYERLLSTIIILFRRFKCLLLRKFSGTQWGVWITKKYLGTTSLHR